MRNHRIRGFSMLELMVSMAFSITFLGAALMLYKGAQDTASMVSQRSTAQVNARSAIDAIAQDLDQAGAGVPTGGLAVPSTASYACKTCPSGGGSYSFPNVGGEGTALYAVMPGYHMGPIINAGQGQTDTISIVYTDRAANLSDLTNCTSQPCGYDSFPLANVNTSSSGSITFNSATKPYANASGVGFQTGDLVLIGNSKGTIIQTVWGGTPTNFTLPLATGDPLGLNTPGSLASIMTTANSPNTFAIKLQLITYYLTLPNLGTGNALPPRLMRQVNALAPTPVAEQIGDLRFTYDIENDLIGDPNANPPILPLQSGVDSPLDPTSIRKINIKISGVGSVNYNGRGLQQVPLTTSVGPRGLSFADQYPDPNGTSSSGF